LPATVGFVGELHREPLKETTTMKYSYKTQEGVISIIPQGRAFHVVLCGEDLGEFGTAQLAADDVSGGHIDTPPRGVDFTKLGIPGDLSEWTQLDS
jgi:hypothetical protein